MYDASALKVFYTGISRKTGVNAPVVFGPHPPSTDGQRVYLPDRGVFTPEEFKAMCGTIGHEIAHLWFDSNKFLKQLLDRNDSLPQATLRTCFNAVIDVADETRMENGIPRMQRLFEYGACRSLDDARIQGSIPRRPPLKPQTLWQMLVVAMLLVRSKPHSQMRKLLRGFVRRPGFQETHRILRRAQDRTKPERFQPMRSQREWNKLDMLTLKLFDVACSHFPNESSDFQSDARSQFSQAAAARCIAVAVARQQSGVVANNPPDEDLREIDGAQPVVDAGPTNGNQAGNTAKASSGPAVCFPLRVHRKNIGFDESMYNVLAPTLRRHAQQLVASATLQWERGHRTGRMIRQPHRVQTDGRIFSRKTLQPATKTAVAVVIDHSLSMRFRLRRFLPVALSMAEALDRINGVEVAVYRFGNAVEYLPDMTQLRKPKLMGYTQTHLALEVSQVWLLSQDVSKRIILLFTDGEPSDPHLTRLVTTKLTRDGTKLLVGSIGVGHKACVESMPRSVVFDVEPHRAGPSLHTAIRRIQRA